MNPRWLLRMSQWARNPPSQKRVLIGLGAILICAVLYGIDVFWGWPDWLTVNQMPRR